MCGICGKINLGGTGKIDEREIRSMMEAMSHRGPDQEGLYVDEVAGLGHMRLSIIDLSSGQQPISNEDGSIWIVFNGEIYNFQALRADLEQKGHAFKTRTDTEVIIHCYEEYGYAFLDKLRGMFAFAIWDARARRLVLARDRVGIKPLYYAQVAGAFLFASEIKALLRDKSVKRELNPDALRRFLSFYYTPGEQTLFDGITKLPPGHFLVMEEGRYEVRRYWDILDFYRNKRDSGADFESELSAILEETVRLHMISDVPVGVLLSGGVDSTGLLSYAVAGSEWEIKAFTIGFEGEQFEDERYYARLAARQYGLEHHELTISKSQFFDFFPKFVWYMEEPVCEPPAIALYYVSKLAREYVTVLISGEGGDEAFAGYPNYRNLVFFEKAKKLFGGADGWKNHLAQKLLSRFDLHKLNKYVDLLDLPLEEYYYSKSANPRNFFNKNAPALYDVDFQSRFSKNCPQVIMDELVSKGSDLNWLDKMLYIDLNTWLPDDLLIKADKMTMANSLELRVPLLDHKVLEFAASLPANMKVNGGTTKYLLKKVLAPNVPGEIINRKKAGFPVPYDRWLKDECREEVFDLLLDRRSLERGYFDKNFVRNFLEKEYSSSQSSPKEIFSLMCLEIWHRIFVDDPGMDVSMI
ncbi:MAG: asparagine synthase (glutamine-hydrolyzing) [Syntrophobacteraceae bacterium]